RRFVRAFTKPEPLRREDNGEFRSETGWPPRHVQPEVLYLTTAGQLGPAATYLPMQVAVGRSDLVYRPDVGIAAGRYIIGQMLPGWGMPDDQRLDEPFSLVHTFDLSDAAQGNVLVGAPVAHLFVSSTAAVAFLSAKLCDVAPDGTSVLVSKAVLN